MGCSYNPLDINFKPGISLNYSYNGDAVCAADLLHQHTGAPPLERLPNWLRKFIFKAFCNSKEFRTALLNEDGDIITSSNIGALGIPPHVAEIYITILTDFRNLARKVVYSTPEEISELIAGLKGKKDIFAIEAAGAISEYNINAPVLSGFVLSQYRRGLRKASCMTGKATPLRPATLVGWSGPDITGLSFGINADTFEDGYIEIRCDNWNEFGRHSGIIEDWSSGVKVVYSDKESVTLTVDRSKVKESISLDGIQTPTATCGGFIIAIEEIGEFNVDIYYKARPDSKDKIHIFSDDYSRK